MGRRYSMQEVAKAAGVSIATVSRVLNRSGSYSEETEAAVIEAARELGYLGDEERRPQIEKRPVIGILVPDITNEYFAEIILELQRSLFENGFLVMVCNVDESKALAHQYIDALISQGVSALVVICGYRWEIDLTEIPVIFIDRSPDAKGQEAVVIESDNFRGGYLAARELVLGGCKKIAFLTDSLEMSSKRARYKGYCRALERAGIVPDPVLITEVGQKDTVEVKKIIKKRFEDGWDVDGIMCTIDGLAVGAVQGIQAFGRRVPEDVKVTGFDDVSITQMMEPGITTIHQNGELMAQKATEFLMELLQGREIEKKHYIVPVTISCRKSTQR